MENWKKIKDYPNYEVSDLGNVRSLDRTIKTSNNKVRFFKGVNLNPSVNVHGYKIVSLNNNGFKKTFRVHKLVAVAFLNHTPSGFKEVVDHINNDKLDNRVDNLQLTTQRHNLSKDKKGSSKYTGVSWHKRHNKWGSQIRVNSKIKHLGYYDCELAAAHAYQKALNAF